MSTATAKVNAYFVKLNKVLVVSSVEKRFPLFLSDCRLKVARMNV